MVHRCLQTPEIVALVCEAVYFNRDCGFDHHRTLARMAKVCSIFRFWAEKLIWTDMHSLLPIIMSLPKNLWSIEGEESGDAVLSFERQLTAQELEEFVAKSKRISRLTLPQRNRSWKDEAAHQLEFLRVAPDVYTMLHHTALAADCVLFPNLVSLIVLDPCPELEPLFDHFGPNLAKVDINLNLHMRDNSICKTFFDNLSHRDQGLRIVKIELAPPDVLENIICALPRLEHLETQSFLTAKSLQHLGGLDTLESLTFKVDPSLSASEWLSPLTFGSIRSLTCQCEHMDDAIPILYKVSHCHLTDLQIEVLCHDTYSTWSDVVNGHHIGPLSSTSAQQQEVRRERWMELVRAVAHNINPSPLVSLRITEHQGWYHNNSPLEFDFIEPLLSLKNLRELEIGAAGGMYIDERGHSNLARCLPLLKKMEIGPPIAGSPKDLDHHYHCCW